ncbi:MAG: TIGR02996 domain-containing protein, partial [Gemmataceae bacterium]
MNPELASLLHTARFALADDAPRLVVADWLEEHGDATDRARAEYVRVSLTLHRLPPWSPQRPPLLARRLALEAGHLTGWAGPLRGWPGVTSLQHERGL